MCELEVGVRQTGEPLGNLFDVLLSQRIRDAEEAVLDHPLQPIDAVVLVLRRNVEVIREEIFDALAGVEAGEVLDQGEPAEQRGSARRVELEVSWEEIRLAPLRGRLDAACGQDAVNAGVRDEK